MHTAASQLGAEPYTVNFSSTSTFITPTSVCSWDFQNDGVYDVTGACDQPVTKVYPGTGSYSAKLKVATGGREDVLTKAVQVQHQCIVERIISSGDWQFRSAWVPNADEFDSNLNVLYLIRNVDPAGLEAEVFDRFAPGGLSGTKQSIVSLIALEWLGVYPNSLPDQDYNWLRMRMTLRSGTVVEGVLAYSGGLLISPALELSCNVSTLAGYPPPTPVPTAIPYPVSYVACLPLGEPTPAPGIPTPLPDFTSLNVRYASTLLEKSIVVGTSVRVAGYYRSVTDLPDFVDQAINGETILAPTSQMFDALPLSVRPLGFALVQWNDNDPGTMIDLWWIAAGGLRDINDCPPPYDSPSTPTIAPPTLTPTSVYEPLYQSMVPIYGTQVPSGENPPAIMGSGGIHLVTIAYTLDTVPLTAEQCIDEGICIGQYDPNEYIPVIAPVSGCIVGYSEARPDLISTLVLKVDCTREPQLHIAFKHLDQAHIDSMFPKAEVTVSIAQGDVLGYLCPRNGGGSCDLGNPPTATHLAVTLVSYAYPDYLKPIPSEIWELERFFPNLHDCYGQSISSGFEEGISPSTPPSTELCPWNTPSP